MTSAASKFTANRVHHLATYSEPGFDLLLKYVESQKFRISSDYKAVAMLHIDEFYWKAHRPFLYTSHPRNKVDGHDIIHNGVHHLLVNRFTSKLKGRTSFSFLCEALAAATDIYYTLVYFKQAGPEHLFVKLWLPNFVTRFKKLKRPFIKTFNQALKDPFAVYQASVLEIFNVSHFCMRLAKNKTGDESYQFKRDLYALTEKMPYWGFTAAFDYHNFVFWASIYCDGTSDRGDARDVKIVLSHLKAATSFEDFLHRLDIDHFIKQQT